MQILLANAKIMFEKADRKPLSTPLFQSVADVLAAEMARMDVKELARQLDCSLKLAAENWQRYHDFLSVKYQSFSKCLLGVPWIASRRRLSSNI